MLATGFALTAIVVLAASSGTVHPLGRRPPRKPLPPGGGGASGPQTVGAPLPTWFDVMVTVGLVMLGTLVGLGLLWALYAGLRMRRDKSQVAEVQRLKAERLTEAVESGLAQVELGTPDNAVIACWVALEQAAAAIDLNRRPAETSAEFTARVFRGSKTSHADLDTLATLYREARYSQHAGTEAARSAARAVLRRLQKDLQRNPVDRVMARVSSRSTRAG